MSLCSSSYHFCISTPVVEEARWSRNRININRSTAPSDWRSSRAEAVVCVEVTLQVELVKPNAMCFHPCPGLLHHITYHYWFSYGVPEAPPISIRLTLLPLLVYPYGRETHPFTVLVSASRSLPTYLLNRVKVL